MTLIRSENAFRVFNFSMANAIDQFVFSFANTSALTPGAQILDTANISPALNQNWTLISVSFQAYLALNCPQPLFGKFGKVIGGLVLDVGQPTQGGTFQPFVSFQSLPSDSALITTLWDGSQDPSPPRPIFSNFNAPVASLASFLPISGGIALPTPRKILGGQNFSILPGIWITPSLLGVSNAAGSPEYLLYVLAATYSIYYDDGL